MRSYGFLISGVLTLTLVTFTQAQEDSKKTEPGRSTIGADGIYLSCDRGNIQGKKEKERKSRRRRVKEGVTLSSFCWG